MNREITTLELINLSSISHLSQSEINILILGSISMIKRRVNLGFATRNLSKAAPQLEEGEIKELLERVVSKLNVSGAVESSLEELLKVYQLILADEQEAS